MPLTIEVLRRFSSLFPLLAFLVLVLVALGVLHWPVFDIGCGTGSGLWRDENPFPCCTSLIYLVEVTELIADELATQRGNR